MVISPVLEGVVVMARPASNRVRYGGTIACPARGELYDGFGQTPMQATCVPSIVASVAGQALRNTCVLLAESPVEYVMWCVLGWLILFQ